jgi:hypothetical protein
MQRKLSAISSGLLARLPAAPLWLGPQPQRHPLSAP